jgi:hypothetical protein
MICEQGKGSLGACLDSQLAWEECEAIAIHLQLWPEYRSSLVGFYYFYALIFEFLRIAPDEYFQQKSFFSVQCQKITGTCNFSTFVSDEQQGIYLIDAQHDASLQLDLSNACSPVFWTQFPWFSVDRKV